MTIESVIFKIRLLFHCHSLIHSLILSLSMNINKIERDIELLFDIAQQIEWALKY